MRTLASVLSGAIALATSGPALAEGEADLSGPHIGIQVGFHQVDDHYYGHWIVTPIELWDEGTHSDAGIVGGVHAGYDHQIGKLVVGGEADIDVADAKVEYSDNTWTYSARIRAQGSIRARLGVIAGPTLVYATGGLALANIEGTYFDSDLSFNVDNRVAHDTVGYTIGGGISNQLNNRLTARIEYRFTDFGVATTDINKGWNTIDNNRTRTHALRFGVSLRL